MPSHYLWARPVAVLAAACVACLASRCPAQSAATVLPVERIALPRPDAAPAAELRLSDQPGLDAASRAAALARLPNKPLPLVEFRGLPLGDAMQAFAEQTKLNIVTSPEAAKVEISVSLRDVKPLDALEAITKANDLYYLVDDQSGIVRISTTKEYERSLSSFREERTEVFTLLYPNPSAVAMAIRNVFGDRVELSFGDTDTDQFDMMDLVQRLNRFDLIDGRSLGLGMIGGGFGQGGYGTGGLGGGLGRGGLGMGGLGRGGLGMGGLGMGTGGLGMGGLGMGMGGFGMGGFGGSGLTSRSRSQQSTRPEEDFETQRLQDLTPEEIQQLEQARVGGTEADQVKISEFLQERKATIFVTVIRRNNQVIVRTGDERTMEQIRDLIARLDVPTPLVLLEVKVLRLALGDEFNSAFDYQFSDGGTVAGGFTSGDILPPASDAINGPARRFASVQPGGDGLNNDHFYFQAVNDSFRMRLQLLENNNRLTTLATPLLLTANNEVSRIFIGETLPFTVGFTPGQVVPTGAGTANTVTSTPITELRDVGQSLLITPNINADRTVTLRIVQEQSEPVKDGARIPVTDAEGGVTEVPVDTVRRNTVSGTVVGMDGLTVALGGLIEERVKDNRAEVPVLGKLPVVGFFFRRQNSVRERAELVILIRPYVFNTPAESAATSEELMQQLSIHPSSCNPTGTLGAFAPHEVIRANPPVTECQKVFRFHSLEPKRY